MRKRFPVIDPEATGENIARLRRARGLSVRDVQQWFGFEEPQAVYKWQQGKTLPSVDNLYALCSLLEVSVEELLVTKEEEKEQQDEEPCCSLAVSGDKRGDLCPEPAGNIIPRRRGFVIELLV